MRPKLLYFYLVFCKEEDGSYNPDIPLTVVNTKKQAFEFSVRHICLKYREHFISWANLKNVNVNDFKIQLEYADKVRKELNNYFRQLYILKPNDMAAILRVTQGCIPIGCSYESQEERNFYENIKEKAKKLMEMEELNNEQTIDDSRES